MKQHKATILSVLFCLVVGALLSLTMTYGFEADDVLHVEYLTMRASAVEDTAIDLTTAGNFANMPAGAIQLRARPDGEGHGGNALELIFAGGATANETFTYKIYAWRRTNGVARMVATGTGTLGTQAVILFPSGTSGTSRLWADTLTVTKRWLTNVASTDIAGNNEVASLQFTTAGYEWFYVEITDASNTGSEAGNVSVWYSYY